MPSTSIERADLPSRAGHGFAAANGLRASKALVGWFDKHPAAPSDATNDAKPAERAAATP
jgi:hypothetical protein